MLSQEDIDRIVEAVEKKATVRAANHDVDMVSLKLGVDELRMEDRSTKKQLSRIEKTVDTMLRMLDRADVDLNKRVRRIEDHLSLPKVS